MSEPVLPIGTQISALADLAPDEPALSCDGVTLTRRTPSAPVSADQLRHPLIGVNMLTSLDHTAPGRLRIGVGAGFPVPESEHEFGAVGIPLTVAGVASRRMRVPVRCSITKMVPRSRAAVCRRRPGR